jgi:hypothetical protein
MRDLEVIDSELRLLQAIRGLVRQEEGHATRTARIIAPAAYCAEPQMPVPQTLALRALQPSAHARHRGDRLAASAAAGDLAALSYIRRSITAMTNPEHLEHLAGLQRLKSFPTNEDSAVGVVIRYFGERGVVCTDDEAHRIVREGALI